MVLFIFFIVKVFWGFGRMSKVFFIDFVVVMIIECLFGLMKSFNLFLGFSFNCFFNLVGIVICFFVFIVEIFIVLFF